MCTRRGGQALASAGGGKQALVSALCGEGGVTGRWHLSARRGGWALVSHGLVGWRSHG